MSRGYGKLNFELNFELRAGMQRFPILPQARENNPRSVYSILPTSGATARISAAYNLSCGERYLTCFTLYVIIEERSTERR